MRSLAPRSLLECACPLFQRIESLAEPYEVPLICKGMAAALWDSENRKIDGASQRRCIFSNRIPREVQAQQAETNQTRGSASQPFMFHYAFLVVWEPFWTGVIVAGSYKLFQPPR
jgi:hypothetical protein